MRNTAGNILWGIAFILVGIGFAGNAFGIWNFELFFDGWWTLFIIVPCGISLVQHGPKAGTVIGLIIGLMFLLSEQNIIRNVSVFQLIVPMIFVAIGVSFIFRNKTPEFRETKEKFVNFNIPNSGGMQDFTAVFGARKVNYQNEVFSGASVNAVFGGVEIDLRNAVINENVRINASAIFGGIDIFVPSNVTVKVSSTPIFGGVSNKVPAPYGDAPCILYINAVCMFGGVEIK